MIEAYESVRNAGSRKKRDFLRGFDFGEYARYIKKIRYVESLGGEAVQAAVKPILFGENKPLSEIMVSEAAFERFCWWEFYNTMVPYEGFRAKERHYNPPENMFDVFSHVFENEKEREAQDYKRKIEACNREIRAYNNRMKHSSFSECGKEFQLRAELGKARCENGLLRVKLEVARMG